MEIYHEVWDGQFIVVFLTTGRFMSVFLSLVSIASLEEAATLYLSSQWIPDDLDNEHIPSQFFGPFHTLAYMETGEVNNLYEHTMSDEFRIFLDQQKAQRRETDPINDLLRQTEHLRNIPERLGVGAATMDFLRQEEERRKMLADITDAGSFAKIAQDYEHQRKLIEGPIEEARRLGLFNLQTDASKLINTALGAQQADEDIFRLPTATELDRIAHEAMEATNLARTVFGTTDRLQAAMATMHSPWLQIEESLASAKAFSEIIAIGHGIDNLLAFDHDFTSVLRSGLGDWRDMLMPAPESLLDPVMRSDFYIERGFDPALTDFTPLAFDEGLRIAGLRDPVSAESDDDQEEYFARSKEAFDQLQRFEVALRLFIQRVMHAAFGDDWMKRQLPTNMLDNWIHKRDIALKAGQPEQPLIDYADFTDYKAIIERKDNWNIVFKPVFGRQEDVRESFQRIFPVRIATMHARLITRDDELLLLVETKRILKTISTK